MAVLGFMVMGLVSGLSLANQTQSSSWWCTLCSAKMDAREDSGRWSDMWCLLLTFPKLFWFSSVQFSCSVMSDSLQPHELQYARPPCPSPTPGVHPNLCPLSRCCHPTISSSVVPFSSCLQSFPASGSSQMSQLFTSGGQSTGVSASASVLPMNTQD